MNLDFKETCKIAIIESDLGQSNFRPQKGPIYSGSAYMGLESVRIELKEAQPTILTPMQSSRSHLGAQTTVLLTMIVLADNTSFNLLLPGTPSYSLPPRQVQPPYTHSSS